MKQNSKKPLERQKIQQNLLQKGQPHHFISQQSVLQIKQQELKNEEAQFLFKKQEKTSGLLCKDSSLGPKPNKQAMMRILEDQAKSSSKKCLMFSQKQSNIDNNRAYQQFEQNNSDYKGKRMSKLGPQSKQNGTVHQHDDSTHNSKDFQKRGKKQIKLLKRQQKSGQVSIQVKENTKDEIHIGLKKQKITISLQLLQTFKKQYPYYVINGNVIFPIEDTLLERFKDIFQENNDTNSKDTNFLTKLPSSFNKELQIWNMMIEYPTFFNIDQDLTIQQIPQMLIDSKSCTYANIFRAFHKFYLNDILFLRYDQSSNEDYYSFISLWRYSEENNFVDKLFHTSWNKFMLFYISIHRESYCLNQLKKQYQNYASQLQKNITEGFFHPPLSYQQLLDYLNFLSNMSFETYTFKALINNKMLFFRDNNKTKNQLLQQKKNIQNQLWQLKEVQKIVVKKQKNISKTYKKEQKNKNQELMEKALGELEAVETQKKLIQQKRDDCTTKINDLQNKIYELCCLPQFSNVWLLGEDRDHNLYWFIKEQESAIYKQNKINGEWFMIKNQNIDIFHNTLDLKGIRERKLYDKILYYKQLGYIKTDQEGMATEEAIQIKQPMQLQQNEEIINKQQAKYVYDVSQFERFSYMDFTRVTPNQIKLMILKSEWMMTKYLYQRNSKWTSDQNRQQYIQKMTNDDLNNLEQLTLQLRTFNEKICVVQINIKVANQSDGVDLKTRKIQTKIWGINQKYKHFWYDYSRKCTNLSDLHFLVSVLYLTIEKYVTKTRKPNNTKYFYKTVEFGQNNQHHEQNCEFCQTTGDLKTCGDCEAYFHQECLSKHKLNSDCSTRIKHQNGLIEIA